jgi:hypothetical protein
MPTFDPSTRFWIGIAVTLCIGISGGAVSLAHAIPADWIPAATAWSSIIAFIGSAVLTGLNGLGMTTQSRLASAASVPEVKSIVTTQGIADITPSDKVVGLPEATGEK